MKKYLILLTACLMASGLLQAQVKEFGWLVGTWKLKDKMVYETWKAASDGKTLEGFSFRIKGTDTIAMEQIRFTYEGNAYHYVPDVPGDQPPVDFRLTQHTAQSFVAENPQHDFPKIIRYKLIRKENTELIEASIEGNGKVIPYHFERVR